jgi:UDP-N-acetylglucosamine diphosphorylase/glucosamine-1-phosphate N-acetyltransferase
VRNELSALTREAYPATNVNKLTAAQYLFVNGRVILTKKLAKEFRKAKKDCVFVSGDVVVGARLSGEPLHSLLRGGAGAPLDFSSIDSMKLIEVDAPVVSYPWDLVYANERELANDFMLITADKVRQSGRIHKSAVLLGKKYIRIGRKSEIGPGVVLDATGGPIFIGERVRILPHTVLEGPCAVGDGSLVRVGTKIYAHTSIGPVCKVGGEVEHSILHSHANKQHDGYLGHSYIAPWVNLGAGTTTSNLKNTYGNVNVRIDGHLVNSGRMFVGLTAADHVKTGINATLDTGTVIGPSSNIFGTAIPPKSIPAFSWGEARNLQTYDLEKALEVAEKVMMRRNVQATEAYKMLFRSIFELTAHERTA